MTTKIRALSLGMLASCEHKSTVEEAMRLFSAGLEDKTASVHPDLRGSVYVISAKGGGRQAWEQLKKLFTESVSRKSSLCLCYNLCCVLFS